MMAKNFEEDYRRLWKRDQYRKNEKFGEIPVPHKKPLVLQVTIVNGKDITRTSLLNLVDKPNPQIALEYQPARGTKKFETSIKIDNVNPVWNETFVFVLPDNHDTDLRNRKAVLKFYLIVEDWHDNQDTIAEASYKTLFLSLNKEIQEEIDFGKKGTINIKIKKEIREDTDIRFSHKLSEEEMDFRCKRIPKVMKNFGKILGDDGPQNLYETPVMSVIGSGGGFRAMIGMCGLMEALLETGLLGCMTYAIGTSGSGWYLSSAYARGALQEDKQKEYHDWLKESLKTSIMREFLSPDSTVRFRVTRAQKKKEQQPVTMVDYYGFCVCDEVLGRQYAHTKLSDLREYVARADVPFLILATQQVHNSVDIWSYHADCNLTPFECEVPHYGINFDMKIFNSDFCCGIVNRKLTEPTLRYVQGTVGSAFSLRLTKLFNLDVDEDKRVETLKRKSRSGLMGLVKSKVEEWFENLPSFMDRGFFIKRTAEILNFARGHDEMKRFAMNPYREEQRGTNSEPTIEGLAPDAEIISIVDAGLLTNVATDAALRPQRANDILFIADYCKSKNDIRNHHVLRKAVTLSKINGLKFPPVDFARISREPLKEFYVFEDKSDPDCPKVFYFYASTGIFRRLKKYKNKDRSFIQKVLEVGEEFTQFDVVGSKSYSTFNTEYSDVEFERLKELMWFNVIINVEIIKRKIREKILQKRSRQRIL